MLIDVLSDKISSYNLCKIVNTPNKPIWSEEIDVMRHNSKSVHSLYNNFLATVCP